MLAVTDEQLRMLLDRRKNGTPPGGGWGVYNVDCEYCGAVSTVVAMAGTLGFSCPYCGASTNMVWLPERQPNGGDLNFLKPIACDKAPLITVN